MADEKLNTGPEVQKTEEAPTPAVADPAHGKAAVPEHPPEQAGPADPGDVVRNGHLLILPPDGLAVTVKTRNRRPATAGRYMRRDFRPSALPCICHYSSMTQCRKSTKAVLT